MKIGVWGAGFSQVPASLGTPSTQRVRPSPSFCALGAQCPPSGQGEITQIPFFETWAEGDASRGEHPALELGGAQGGGQATPRPQSRDRQGRSLKGNNPARSKPMENRGGCSPSSVCGEGAQGLRRLSPIKFLAAQRGRGRVGATAGAVSVSLSPPGRCRPLPPPGRHCKGRGGDTGGLGCHLEGKNWD